jgi:Calcineurin-like phosphoesterase
MHPATTDRDRVLAVITSALSELEGGGSAEAASAALHGMSPQELASALREGLEFMTHEEPRLAEKGELEDLRPGAEYISRHTVVALVQSAMEEVAERDPGRLAGPAPRVPLGTIAENVHLRDEGDAPFPTHEGLDDFVFPLAEECTVVLVGDWGTGSTGAKRVARAIRRADPDHVIHLGDIYPSGKPEEVEKHFLRVWREHGPPNAKYWALIGNHEMKSGGHAYFRDVLGFCRDQTASYFALENEHWKLIGLDTAHTRAHDLHPAQAPWLMRRLTTGSGRKVLLTHHQPFSAVDERPGEHNLFNTMQDFIATEQVFGWFWGHEHGFLSYRREAVFGNFLARSIGHGGKDVRNPYFEDEIHPSPKVVQSWGTTRPGDPRWLANGFALLRFRGPELHIAYRSEHEDGPEKDLDLHTEIWPDHPHE